MKAGVCFGWSVGTSTCSVVSKCGLQRGITLLAPHSKLWHFTSFHVLCTRHSHKQRPMNACVCVCVCVCLCVCVCCSSQGISVKRCTKLWGQHFYGIIWKTLIRHLGFPGSSVGKEPACRFNRWVRKILWRRKWQPTPYSCLENPMDRGAWWATVYGVTRVGHDLASKWLPPPPP